MWTPILLVLTLLSTNASCIEFSGELKNVFGQALRSLEDLKSKLKEPPSLQTEAIPLQISDDGANVQFSIQQSQNEPEKVDLEFFDEKYGDLVNLLPTVADAIELAIFFLEPEDEELQSFIEKCNELNIKIDSSSKDGIEVMTLYALEILQVIMNNAKSNQNVASNNLLKIQKIIDAKRQSLIRAQDEIPDLQRSEVTIQNNMEITQDEIKESKEKINDKNSKRKKLEKARAGTFFCAPCVIGFTVAIEKLKDETKKLQNEQNGKNVKLAGLLIQFGRTKAKLIAFRLTIKRLEKELLEVNGLKNDLIEGRDNFRTVESSLEIIQKSANQTIKLLEECQENLGECDSVIVIRTKIEALKKEGKTVWNFLIDPIDQN